MIDLHTHILPDLDDGPSTLEESLDLAAAAWESGTKTIVATPHILNRLSLANNSQISQRYRSFKEVIAEKIPGLTVLLGTEIYFQPNLANFVSYDAGTLNGTRKYLLVEFPLGDIPKMYDRELLSLAKMGIVPVIAHPERNAVILDKPAIAGKIVKMGALLQINSGSLTGMFGRTVRKLAQYLLKMGWVHIIASDMHSFNRGPELTPAVDAAAEVIGSAAARRLVTWNARIILDGLPWSENERRVNFQGEEDDGTT